MCVYLDTGITVRIFSKIITVIILASFIGFAGVACREYAYRQSQVQVINPVILPSPFTKSALNQPLDGPAAQSNTKSSGARTVTNKTAISTPCQAYTPTILQPIAVSPKNPGLNIEPNTISNYTVLGANTQDVNATIFRCSPVIEGGEHFAASTEYRLSWNYSYVQADDQLCTIEAVSVGLSTSQVLPQINHLGQSNLQANWDRFINNLVIHENGHLDIDRSHAQSLYSSLKAIPPTNCADLSGLVSSIARREIDSPNATNQAYDTSTKHGTTQGATL